MNGLGLTNEDFSTIEDWEWFGYTSPEEYASFKEQIKNHEEEDPLYMEDETLYT